MSPDARDSAGRDGGFTLLELMVSVFIFVIVMTIVFTSMSGWVINTEARITKSDQASGQVEQAFQTLDSEIRYAADINPPGQSASGDFWLEFQSDWTSTTLGSPQCTQLEYVNSTGTLQQRSWLIRSSATPPAALGWRTLATNLARSVTADPFTLSRTAPDLRNPSTPTTAATTTTVPLGTTTTTVAPEVAATPWQVGLSLTSTFGVGQQSGSSQSSFSITAVDVTVNSSYQDVCGGNPA